MKDAVGAGGAVGAGSAVGAGGAVGGRRCRQGT